MQGVPHGPNSDRSTQRGGDHQVKTHTKLEKVISAYCQKKAIEPSSVRFVFDGTRVAPMSTPESLGMDDGDSIDVFQEQVGGGGR